MSSRTRSFAISIGIVSCWCCCAFALAIERPNVILVLTDDQGYGDWGFKGKHPYLKTPAVDQLAADGIFLTDFHVNPLCAPTRAALMSGREAFSVRCWQGRHQLRADVPTLGNIFEDNGYKTALFGKWHLGDDYPFRAMERGFQETVTMTNGMVNTANDWPGNIVLNNCHFKHNDVWKKYPGYTTDVWFDQAIKFIEANRSTPFFVYLATDAPHDPHIAPASDIAPYKDIDFPNMDSDDVVAQFYGQIASIDRNLARLRDKLKELDLTDDTILIFMGDNGSGGGGSAVWNGGLTGGKGAATEGGHRVPFFIHWPAGGLTGGLEIGGLTAHIDVMPTLIDLCGLTPPADTGWHGVSLKDLLTRKVETPPSRSIFIGYSVSQDAPTRPGGCVARDQYRLLYNSGQFFDVAQDPAQSDNLARDPAYREIKQRMAADLQAHHDLLAKSVYPYDDPSILGHPSANPTRLNAVYGRKDGSQGFSFLRTVYYPAGRYGRLIVKAETAGQYQVSLYRWPPLAAFRQTPIRGSLSRPNQPSQALDIRKARLQFSDAEGVIFEETQDVADTDVSSKFTVQLPADKQMSLKTWFIDGSGTEICGAIVVEVFKVPTGQSNGNSGDAAKTPKSLPEGGTHRASEKTHYEPTWESLAQHGAAPRWYRDAVFGIYFHWGIYSVPGYGGEKYPRDMYKVNSGTYKHHCDTYGDPMEFGYHDFIPMFKAEKWDPDRWAALFKAAGADFAGPIAEHHDGFAIWDTQYDEYNSMKMGPRRDIVGEMVRAVRRQGMKVVVTFHHMRWDYYNAGKTLCPEGVGVNDPELSGLYGRTYDLETPEAGSWLSGGRVERPQHQAGNPVFESFREEGYNKFIEVIDKYRPDQIQTDGFTCVRLGQDRLRKVLAHHFNTAEKSGREVVVSRGYDSHHPYTPSEMWGKEVMISRVIPISCSVQNIERHFPEIPLSSPCPNKWQATTPVPGFSYSYVASQEDKTSDQIEDNVDALVDGIVNVKCKNGVTLLSVAPKPDGTLPESQVKVLKRLGHWMRVNSDALRGAECRIPCEAGTLRFTRKGPYLYAIDLEEPTVPTVIPGVTPVQGSNIRMLGSDKKLAWHQIDGNVVIEELPDPLPCDHAWVFTIGVDEVADESSHHVAGE